MALATRYELLVGLHVSDNEMYARYRAAMTPLLEAAGGHFRVDFTIEDVLKGPQDPAINRLFVISFPSERASDAFFADPDYVAAKDKFFGASVDRVEIIAAYEHKER